MVSDGWKVTSVTSADGNLRLTVAVPDAGIIAGYRFPCRLELENVGDVAQTVNLSGFWALHMIVPQTECVPPAMTQLRSPSLSPAGDFRNLAPGERVTVLWEEHAWLEKTDAFMAWYENHDAGGGWTGTVGPLKSASVLIIGGEKALHYGLDLMENGIERDYATGIAIPVEEEFAEWERSINRGNGARLLGDLKDTAAVGPLLHAVRNDGKLEVQVKAAMALYKIADMTVPGFPPDDDTARTWESRYREWIPENVPRIEAWAESYLREHPAKESR